MWKKKNEIDENLLDRMKVGLGKRLQLSEMLMLEKSIKDECNIQMGMGYMPKGFKSTF